MIKIGYNSTPVVQVTMSGDVTATFLAETLTVTNDGRVVTLDDTTTQQVVAPFQVRGVQGQRFNTAAELALYFQFLKEGGTLLEYSDSLVIDTDVANNTVTFNGGQNFDAGSLQAVSEDSGTAIVNTFKIKQGAAILFKGINPASVVFNGSRVTKGTQALVDLLNDKFRWVNTDLEETDNSNSRTSSTEDRFGYAFTGGFAGKPASNNYAWEDGTAISLTAGEYTHMQFDPTVQAAVDSPYWGSPLPTGNNAHVDADIFEGIHLPDGVSRLFDYDYVWPDGGVGRIDVSGAQPGDLLRVRMDYNVIPSISNSVIEAALDFSTRDFADNVTFQFYLTANPSTFGNTSAGQTYLLRTEMTAYFASNEDVNALIRPVVKCNNICQVQPLSILAILQK